MKKRVSKKPDTPERKTIAFDAPVYSALHQYAQARGMVLRIAAERAMLAGLRLLSGEDHIKGIES